jgi:hypothetical protein
MNENTCTIIQIKYWIDSDHYKLHFFESAIDAAKFGANWSRITYINYQLQSILVSENFYLLVKNMGEFGIDQTVAAEYHLAKTVYNKVK